MAKVTILGAGNAGHAFAYDIQKVAASDAFEHPISRKFEGRWD